MNRRSKIVAVVPTLDEEEHVAPCLTSLRAAGIERVVVVDAGSGDATRERARPLADQVIVEKGGLFAQLDRGAREADGEVLLFQYADGRLPSGGASAIEEGLRDPRVLGGAFRLRFESRRHAYRLVAAGARVRNFIGFGPFGDQSIFVRADAFAALGGFRQDDPLPDYDLVRRLRARGRFRLLSEQVTVSVRRWEERGFLRTALSHWKVTAAYALAAARGQRGGSLRREVDELRRVR